MYMIANNKMRKAKKAREATEPYFETLQSALSLAMHHLPDVDHPYFDARPGIAPANRKTAYLVITGDKGLAGAYHQNIFKLLEASLAQTANNQIYVIGQMGVHYLRRRRIPFDVNFMYTAQDPSLGRARDIGTRIFDLFREGLIDDVYVIYTRMQNAATMTAEKFRLLPLDAETMAEPAEDIKNTFVLYPTPEAVVSTVVPDYVVGFVYGALVESYCSEQNARVMAMENATDSAKDILADLKLEYNRVRQANITQEITEIIGGARAQKGK
jgi:F-type H+-transporting ATPase subunit gamma